jgi:hypothetical protein
VSESESHKRAKRKAAGLSGQKEAPLPNRRRLDAETSRKATEVERSSSRADLEKAASRLESSGKPQKVLQVPEKNMDKAAAAMRAKGVGGTVKNMSGTKRRSISKKR